MRAQEGLDASYGNCMGWTQMLCALKMYLERGVNLREFFFQRGACPCRESHGGGGCPAAAAVASAHHYTIAEGTTRVRVTFMGPYTMIYVHPWQAPRGPAFPYLSP